jgi:hypothetical protein
MRVGFAGAAALVAFCAAAAAGAAPPTGDPKGLALLERVHRAYRTVPAVGISLRLGAASFDYKLVLRAGIGVAEQVVVRQAGRTTTLVARLGGPTWVRDPGRACWRRLAPAPSDSQAIHDLGQRFPDQLLTRVKAPRRTPTGWRLPVSISGETAAFVIDRKSLLIRSIVVANPQMSYVEHVTALRPAPRLAFPTRRC